MVGPGDLIAGRYRLEEEIESHGTSTLLVATDEARGRRVVVEIGGMNDDSASDPKRDARRRARAATALTHPGIARVLDAGDHDGQVFVVSELVEGRDLLTIRGDSPIRPRNAVAWCLQILEALEHAHEAGVSHGSLTAKKVMLATDGRVKITGFGSFHQRLERDDRASDLVATARILDELLGGDARENPLPDPLESLLAKATAIDPSQRYSSASEIARALRAIPPEDLDPLYAPEPGREDSRPSTTVWPIPGARYDPTALGRRVIAIAIIVALIALGAFLSRVASRVSEGDGPSPTPSPSGTETSGAGMEGNLPPGLDVTERRAPSERVTLISSSR